MFFVLNGTNEFCNLPTQFKIRVKTIIPTAGKNTIAYCTANLLIISVFPFKIFLNYYLIFYRSTLTQQIIVIKPSGTFRDFYTQVQIENQFKLFLR